MYPTPPLLGVYIRSFATIALATGSMRFAGMSPSVANGAPVVGSMIEPAGNRALPSLVELGFSDAVSTCPMVTVSSLRCLVPCQYPKKKVFPFKIGPPA